MFVVLLAFHALNWLGGGDVKILAVAFLWTGLSAALPFAILLALFFSVHALAAKLCWGPSQTIGGGRRRIPSPPSVAAPLICIFLLRSFQFSRSRAARAPLILLGA